MKRLEQEDSYRTHFESEVSEVRREGDATWISLRASLFYPTSGGQPHDTGLLRHADGEARVLDVVLEGDEVWHRLSGTAPAQGVRVRGAIDADRRLRHMQRHSAQHLVSQAFVRVNPAFETHSVSLASADVTVDLAGDPDEDDQQRAFRRANAWAYANLPIEAFVVDEQEIDRIPLRRPPKVSGRVRLVRMGWVEVAACGGTHLRATAEMLPLLRISSQRIRSDLTRVTFRAGREATALAQEETDRVRGLARSFSSRPDQVPQRVEALRDELVSAERRAARWLGEAARLRAERLVDAAERIGEARLVVCEVDSGEALDALSETLGARGDVVAVLAAGVAGRAQLRVVRGPGLDVDVRPILQAGLAPLDGRGGGRPERAQGAGEGAERIELALAEATAQARRALAGGPGDEASGRAGR